MGDTASAMQTFKDIVTRFPEDGFCAAGDLPAGGETGKDGKTEEMVKLLAGFHQDVPG